MNMAKKAANNTHLEVESILNKSIDEEKEAWNLLRDVQDEIFVARQDSLWVS